jgi:hypothetical protein
MWTTSKTAGEPHEGLLMIASADGGTAETQLRMSLGREAHRHWEERFWKKTAPLEVCSSGEEIDECH